MAMQIVKIPPEKPRPNEIPERKETSDLDLRIQLLARLMDSVFHVPGLGIRFGLDSIIGLIPGFGDTVTSFVSLYILNAASRLGVPRVTLLRMAANIAIDFALGSIPLVGDAFDVYWKANQKNVELVRRHTLATPADERRARSGDWFFIACLIGMLILLLVGSIATAVFVLTWVGRRLGNV